uniref:Superoxide dismutase n=1 Tax=Liposcelis bostrychophila TaxID=185214 RepID=A0AA51NQZ7_LIPBO|nr:Fe/Mn-SOD [Liposcelis bostrychophila]
MAAAAFKLPRLPWADGALAPHISAETISFHYGKHHQAYVTKLNELVGQSADFKGKRLLDIIRQAPAGTMRNQAGQVYNHCFYWDSMSPNGGGEPRGEIRKLIDRDFGSFAAFKEKFSAVAAGHFGSGWAWLVKTPEGKVAIEQTHDGDSIVMKDGVRPLLTCDVWEHAYYIDYRNARPKYIEAWWNLINWDFANANLGALDVYQCEHAHNN